MMSGNYRLWPSNWPAGGVWNLVTSPTPGEAGRGGAEMTVESGLPGLSVSFLGKAAPPSIHPGKRKNNWSKDLHALLHLY